MFVKVDSSQIHSLAYRPDDQILHVRFLCPSCKGKSCEDCPKCKGRGHASEYCYEGVPASVYGKVRDGHHSKLSKDNPASVGRAFGEHIRGGGFNFKRIK